MIGSTCRSTRAQAAQTRAKDQDAARRRREEKPIASSRGRGKSDAGATQKNSRDGRHVRGLWGSRHETSILFVQNGEELRRRVPGESLGGPQGLRQGAGQRQRAGRGSLSLRRRKARSRRCPCSCRWANADVRSDTEDGHNAGSRGGVEAVGAAEPGHLSSSHILS